MKTAAKILLIDDDPGIVDTLSRVLTDEGYEVAVEKTRRRRLGPRRQRSFQRRRHRLEIARA